MTEAALSRQRTSFWGAALTLSLATLLTRAATFFTHAVIAYRFGAGAHTDAYFAAERVLLLLGDFIVIGFGAAFIPLWMEYQVRGGERAARAFVSTLITLATGATIVLAIVIALAAPIVVRLVAPGFAGGAAEIARQLLATMTPAVAFLGLTAGCTALLEAHRRFVLPEISRLACRSVILAATIALSSRLGIMALALGTVAGSLVQLIIQLSSVLKFGTIHLTPRVDLEGVRRAGKRILPILMAHAGMPVTMLLGSMVASGLHEGAVSGLAYAARVILLPVGLLALPLRTTIFPTLSLDVAKDQLDFVAETAMRGLRVLIFVTLPVCAGLVLLRVPLIRLLFERGAFDSAATQMTAGVLGFYALGLPAIGGMLIVNSIYFSLGDPMTLVKFNLMNWAACLALSLTLVGMQGPGGIALGISLSTTTTYALALMSLKQRLPALKIRPLGETVLKALVATGLMAALLLGLSALLAGASPELEAAAMHPLTVVLGSAVVGASTYGIGAVALRMEEALAFIGVVSQRLRLRS